MATDDPSSFADAILGMASAHGHARMARVLLQKDVIDRTEFEAMRHLFLRDLDQAVEMEGITSVAAAAIENTRSVVERFWDLRVEIDAEPGPKLSPWPS